MFVVIPEETLQYVCLYNFPQAFTCILHAKATVYVMAASIHKPKYLDKE